MENTADEKKCLGASDVPPLRESEKPDLSSANPQNSTEDTVIAFGLHVHPQPTADPLDPLNWSKLQKNAVLGIVMFKYIPSSGTMSIS